MKGRVGYDQRKVHKSHLGYICPMTTPESGAAVGRYFALTIPSYYTKAKANTEVYDYLKTKTKK